MTGFTHSFTASSECLSSITLRRQENISVNGYFDTADPETSQILNLQVKCQVINTKIKKLSVYMTHFALNSSEFQSYEATPDFRKHMKSERIMSIMSSFTM